MLIRAATAADLPQIKALWNDMICNTTSTFTSTPKTDTGLAAMLEERTGSFLVAVDSATVLGFVTWGPFRAGDGYAYTVEHSIITATSGQGIGRALMQAAFAGASAQGMHAMIAGIGHENTAAVAFHTRLGFAMAGRLPQVGRKNGQWHDLILMNRPLAMA